MNTELNSKDAKLISVLFQVGTGGKFIINCLSLASNAVMQDIFEAKCQLSNRDYDKIVSLKLRAEISSSRIQWDDFMLGNKALYGQGYKAGRILEYNVDILNKVIDKNLYMFSVQHSISDMHAVYKLQPLDDQPCATLIHVVNTSRFVRQYRNHLNLPPAPTINEYWNTIRGSNWPVDPPSKKDIYLLPDKIQTELYSIFNGEIEEFYYPEGQKVIHWNSENLFNEEVFLIKIEELYNALGLEGFNKNLLSEFRNLYLTTIEANVRMNAR